MSNLTRILWNQNPSDDADFNFMHIYDDGVMIKYNKNPQQKYFFDQIIKISVNDSEIELLLNPKNILHIPFSKTEQATVSRNDFLKILIEKIYENQNLATGNNPSNRSNKILSWSISGISLFFIIFIFINASSLMISNLKHSALKENNSKAAYLLAYLYKQGKYTSIDINEYLLWLKKSAQEGNSKAAYELANIYREGKYRSIDKKEYLLWLQKAVKDGSAWATNDLAYLYSTGQDVPRDKEMAKNLYTRAASGGDYLAMYNLGLIYSGLNEVEKKPTQDELNQAVYWYKKSLEKNVYCAAHALGVLYATGKGVALDSSKAREFFSKSGSLLLQGENISDDAINTIKTLNTTLNKNDLLKAYAVYQYSKINSKNNTDNFQKFSPNIIAAVKYLSKITDKCWKSS